MTTTPGEKIDSAHWVTLFAGGLMFCVLLLISVALMFPWWTTHLVVPGKVADTEVSLWILYTRMELAADKSTLDCERQCDFTRLGGAKVRESRLGWTDVCVEADEAMAPNCQQIWFVRVGTMGCWFLSLIFTTLSTFNFCGAGLPASVRCAPQIKLGLGVCCVLCLIVALCVGTVMDIRLAPNEPGTEPRDHPPPGKVGLNGPGFLCALISCILSILGTGVAYCAQNVVAHLDEMQDWESGRPLADVNRGKAPNLSHQVQKIQVEPPATKLGLWVDSRSGSKESAPGAALTA